MVSSIKDAYPKCRMLVMTTGRECTTGTASGESLETIHKPFDLTAVVRLVSSLAAEAGMAISGCARRGGR